MESGVIIQLGRDELTRIINDAVRAAMPQDIREATPQPFIKGIHELAAFLKVSPARAQKLKNEGAFPYWQDGRTLLFDPDAVRAAMANINKPKR
ncbi:hypothetical protein TBC1_12481 [Lentimicrobium saccharophilum]|uniref:Uncharacterized protein n=1 Tax=Lentimicrobium saccharophilum TaxID=1678841 RepID=A0A0S7C3C3_9BACT|nr:helix-turn-helix domain-containing protein [Lentimicrobium saccharophilum]GAP44670.1 hypothetical protein TBC1_12481 [Lentimicrobium saccharophilum]